MNASTMGNFALLGSVVFAVVVAPAAPAFAVSSIIAGIAIKAGLEHHRKQIEEAEKRRKKRRRED